jgi:hypothetical protein
MMRIEFSFTSRFNHDPPGSEGEIVEIARTATERRPPFRQKRGEMR